MKLNDAHLELQALLDGELDSVRQASVAQRLASDPDAALIFKTLKLTRQAVKDHEPRHAVPDAREFYFSRIQQRLGAEKPAATRPEREAGGLGWLRWLAPALGAAVLALAVFRVGEVPTGSVAVFLEAESASASGMVFRSESDGVTIHWIN